MAEEGRNDFALALGGGGALGYAHVGVIRALAERGLHAAAFSGTSIGAVVAAIYACDMAEEGERALRGSRLADFLLAAVTRGASYRRLVRDLFGGWRVGDCERPLVTCAAPARDKTRPIYLSAPGLFVWEAVAASSALPIAMAPFHLNGERLIDGGAADNLPAAPLRKLGLPVIGVDLGFLRGGLRGDEAPRGFWLRIKHRTALVARYRDVGDFLIELRLRGFGPAGFGRFEEIEALGYEAGVRFLESGALQTTKDGSTPP